MSQIKKAWIENFLPPRVADVTAKNPGEPEGGYWEQNSRWLRPFIVALFIYTGLQLVSTVFVGQLPFVVPGWGISAAIIVGGIATGLAAFNTATISARIIGWCASAFVLGAFIQLIFFR